MSPNLRALLLEIENRKKRYGGALQPPCSSKELMDLRASAHAQLQVDLRPQYEDFLGVTNGLFWNGLMVYASQESPIIGHPGKYIEGFVGGNMLNRGYEPLKEYLIFAEAGVEMYTLHMPQDSYVVIDRVSLDVYRATRSFDELMVDALQDHLD